MAQDHTTQQWQILGDHGDFCCSRKRTKRFLFKIYEHLLSMLTWGMCSGLATDAHIPRETLLVAIATSRLPHSLSFAA